MKNLFEKEKKLNEALEKLNLLNPQNSNLKESIVNLDQQKNQLEIEKKELETKYLSLQEEFEELKLKLDKLNQLKDKPYTKKEKAIVILVLDDKFYPQYYEILKTLRTNKINSEIYPGGNVKLSKQLQYCAKNSSPIAIVCGEEEFKNNKIKYKVIQGKKNENEFSATKNNLIDEIKKILK